MNNNLPQTIESILFATADTYTIAALSKICEVPYQDIENALTELERQLQDHAMMLVRQGDTVVLATRPQYSEVLETIRKEELNKDLSKASAETLAVVIYKPGATKAEIELIRGVNASYSLRALQMRGLIETKIVDRNAAYYPTISLLESYGVADSTQLPLYAETKEKLATLLSQELEQ